MAFRADHDPRPELGWTWENIHEETRENYRAVAAAVAEACAVDRAAPLANEEPTDAGLARMIRSMTEALRSDAEIGRAIYDFGREHGRADADAALATENVTLAAKLRMAEKENATLRDRAEKAERESTICLACAASGAASRPLPALRPTAHVPVESAGADGARLALSEAEMAAELREAGWTPSAMTGRWYLPIGSAGGDGGRVIADAHAAMRAAKGAR